MDAGAVPEGLRAGYPFTAVVGQSIVKKALLCALASDSIDGVLIRGPAGTAKTTIVRALDGMVPHSRILNLPLNVTEEQIVGGTDMEAALRQGQKRVMPGLLHRANGNILYIDGINLLAEHLVHLVLDSATRKRSTVEREGISWDHECRFLVVGTMDPEEGGLSPSLLDRFDLCVSVSAVDDMDERMEILRRSLDYDRDPVGFRRRFIDAEEELSGSIRDARGKAPYVLVPPGLLDASARLCQELRTDGHRGDIALVRTAIALAALHGREQIILEDLQEAAPLCLEHRRKDFEEDRSGSERGADIPSDGPNTDGGGQGRDPSSEEGPAPSSGPEPPSDQNGGETPERVFPVGRPFVVIDYLRQGNIRSEALSGHGRRDKVTTTDGSGRYVSFRLPRGRTRDMALDASIRAAAPYQRMRQRNGLAVVIEPPDLREKVRQRKQGTTMIFLVDASGSMGAHRRMVMVKGAVLALLRDAYQKRDTVGMIAFRKESADVILPPTRSVHLASRKLEHLPTGGRTPLAAGLWRGYELLIKECGSTKGRPVMVIITDGRANTSMGERDPFEEALDIARRMADAPIRYVVVDTGTGFPRIDLARRLCKALGGTYFLLEELDSERLASSVRAVVGGRGRR